MEMPPSIDLSCKPIEALLFPRPDFDAAEILNCVVFPLAPPEISAGAYEFEPFVPMFTMWPWLLFKAP